MFKNILPIFAVYFETSPVTRLVPVGFEPSIKCCPPDVGPTETRLALMLCPYIRRLCYCIPERMPPWPRMAPPTESGLVTGPFETYLRISHFWRDGVICLQYSWIPCRWIIMQSSERFYASRPVRCQQPKSKTWTAVYPDLYSQKRHLAIGNLPDTLD